MKKFIYVFVFVLVALLLAGCNSNKSTVPTLEDLKNANDVEEYNEKIKEIQKAIDETSYEDICLDMEKTLGDWAKSQDLLNIEDTSIEFIKDETIMNSVYNEKMYNNISVKIRVDYVTDGKVDNERDLVYEAMEQVEDAMSKNIYYNFKVFNRNNLPIGFYKDDKLRYGSDTISKNIFNSCGTQYMKFEIDPDEMNVQTMVYDFVKKWDEDKFGEIEIPISSDTPINIFLHNFGVIEDDNSLYIFIAMHSQYLDKSAEETLKDIEAKSLEMKDLILGDKNAREFLEGKGVTKIKFSFYTDWVKENYQNYEYDI